MRAYIQELRPHHWLKNLLLFLPALAAHHFYALQGPLIAFVAFCLCASGGYIVNDLLDIKSDRQHGEKKLRPLASGQVSATGCAILAALLFIGAFAIAAWLGKTFIAYLGIYLFLSLFYSAWLKKLALVDILTLVSLYGVRILAGGPGVGLVVSPWLTAFSLFLFLSISVMKRCAELVRLQGDGGKSLPGRAYRVSDLPILNTMMVSAGFVAALVFALYINGSAVTELYRSPQYLWFICAILIFWIGRASLLTTRGQMHHDPIVYAASDPASLSCAALIVALAWISI